MDCIIVGYNEVKPETAMPNLKSMEKVSGAYRHMLSNVVYFRGNWLHYMDFLKTILEDSTGKKYNLSLMEMPNLGVCYLKSFLNQRNLDVEIVNFYSEEKEHFKNLLLQRPRAVAVTTTFYADSSPITEIMEFIRQHNSETTVIVGGPYIFNNCNRNKDITTQDYILDSIGADIYINDSQGEDTLSKLLYELRKGKEQNLANIPNLIFRSNPGRCPTHQSATIRQKGVKGAEVTSYIRTQRRVESNNMDENAIDWGLLLGASDTPTVQMRTSRGCPFSCAFCSFPLVAGPFSHTSLDTILKEMKHLHHAGVKNLIFIDDTLNVPLPRFKKVLKMMIDSQFGFDWFSYFRCASADNETFDLMQESGCKGVFLGLESGDQSILDNMNKQVKIDQYRNGMRKLNERDIITFASFVVGFPGETEKTIQNTINFIEETRPTYYKAQIYFHANDVPINKEAHKYGLISSGYSWRHNTMDWKKACDMVELMYKTIEGSIVFPLYMFDFWAIPYLLGKGVNPEHLKEFLTLTQPILTKNFFADSLSGIDESAIYNKLLALGTEISRDIESMKMGGRG